MRIEHLDSDQITQRLAYAGLILVAFELVKSLIVHPIKLFYRDTTFGEGMPFTTYDQDVRWRHRDEFEACLLYLRDFMEAIGSADLDDIQELRKHRNELAHALADRLPTLDVAAFAPLLERATRALFKLSNYRVRMECSADPEYRNKGVDWDTVTGDEYFLLQQILAKVRILNQEAPVA